MRSIIAWSLLCAIPAMIADVWLYRYAMNHLESRGHVYVPHNGFVIAITLTGFAMTVPIVGILLRRQAVNRN